MARFTMERVQTGGHFAILHELGLTPGHLKALAVIHPDEPRPMGVMADIMRCDASQMTWLIDRLEERDLVERRTMPSDRRVKSIALTPRGVEVRRLVLDKLFEPPEELLGLDATTLEALREHLQKLPPSGGIFGSAGDRIGADAP
ncbi:MAG: MarR family transcriptional regulator [Actinobacteria bacterium]|nr:MarR family transcriptional regulator [Actinomycetota bacterium]